MAFSAINTVDVGIISVISLFVIFGLMRGFTSDFLGFFTWIGAILSAKILYKFVQPIVSKHVQSIFFIELISILIPFILSLVILVTIVHFISRMVQGSIFGRLDRTLGVISGWIRGSIILCIIYIGVLMYYKPGEKPLWLKQSKAEFYLIYCTKVLYQYVIPKHLFPIQVKHHLFNERYMEKEKTMEEHVRILSKPLPIHRNTTSKNKGK